ncbi:MAG: hypothetical protein M3014_09980 [Chloroflexota bacterium]|nr:hypothetical protein [Chloroflexota bacterium]
MYIPPSTAPGVDPIISRLRPRAVGEIIDQAFRLYRKYFLTFVAITAVIYVPSNLLIQGINAALQGTARLNSSPYGTTVSDSNSSIASGQITTIFVLGGLLLLLGLLAGILQYISQGALTSAVADSHMERPISFGGAYRKIAGRVGSLLGAMALQVLIAVAIFLPALVIVGLALLALAGATGAGSSSNTGGLLGGFCLGFALIIPLTMLYIYVVVRLEAVIPALVIEKLGPMQAIRRSWSLVGGYWWRTAALRIVLAILGAVIAAGPAYLVLAIVLVFAKGLDIATQTLIQGAFTVLGGMFFIPLQLISSTLYYFDLRVRKEGFDLETAMQQRYFNYTAPAQGYTPPPGWAGHGQVTQQVAPAFAPPTLGYSPPMGNSYSGQGEGTPTRAIGEVGPVPEEPRESLAEDAMPEARREDRQPDDDTSL